MIDEKSMIVMLYDNCTNAVWSKRSTKRLDLESLKKVT